MINAAQYYFDDYFATREDNFTPHRKRTYSDTKAFLTNNVPNELLQAVGR